MEASKESVRRTFENRLWFAGPISEKKAEEVLSSLQDDGSFLVRDSFLPQADFVLSVNLGIEIIHYDISVDESGECQFNNYSFTDLPSAIQFYMENRLGAVYLKLPIEPVLPHQGPRTPRLAGPVIKMAAASTPPPRSSPVIRAVLPPQPPPPPPTTDHLVHHVVHHAPPPSSPVGASTFSTFSTFRPASSPSQLALEPHRRLSSGQQVCEKADSGYIPSSNSVSTESLSTTQSPKIPESVQHHGEFASPPRVKATRDSLDDNPTAITFQSIAGYNASASTTTPFRESNFVDSMLLQGSGGRETEICETNFDLDTISTSTTISDVHDVTPASPNVSVNPAPVNFQAQAPKEEKPTVQQHLQQQNKPEDEAGKTVDPPIPVNLVQGVTQNRPQVAQQVFSAAAPLSKKLELAPSESTPPAKKGPPPVPVRRSTLSSMDVRHIQRAPQKTSTHSKLLYSKEEQKKELVNLPSINQKRQMVEMLLKGQEVSPEVASPQVTSGAAKPNSSRSLQRANTISSLSHTHRRAPPPPPINAVKAAQPPSAQTATPPTTPIVDAAKKVADTKATASPVKKKHSFMKRYSMKKLKRISVADTRPGPPPLPAVSGQQQSSPSPDPKPAASGQPAGTTGGTTTESSEDANAEEEKKKAELKSVLASAFPVAAVVAREGKEGSSSLPSSPLNRRSIAAMEPITIGPINTKRLSNSPAVNPRRKQRSLSFRIKKKK